MPILNPNSTDYQHPWEPNLSDIHTALDYTEDGKPALRVLSNIQGDIVIEGDVSIPGTVKVENADGTTLSVDGTVSVDNFPNVQTVGGTVSVNYADSADLSAFSRLRSANTRLLGEFRNQYGTMGPVEIVTRFENGGGQTINLAQAHTIISVTDQPGSRALRQSRKYHPYIPGTTNLAFISFTMAQGKTNLQQMAGLFDDLNGILFRMNGVTPEMVIRKAGVDDQIVPQSEWNVDRLDGTGPSGIGIDFAKSQILIIDYQWLGVGRVRVGFNIDGQIYYTHYFNHANTVTEPYLFQPSLPVRWEIVNSGATSGASDMMCVAYGVYVEGSEVDTGFTESQGDIGFTGSRGEDGTIGVDGFTGSQGDTGFTGSAGEGADLSITDDTSTNETRYVTFVDQTSGDVAGVGISSTKLFFNPSSGTLNATEFNSLSDCLFKENVKPIKDAISVVKNLKGTSFICKQTQKGSYGLIAQEVQDVLPEIVSESEFKTVNYNAIIPFLIEAIKELNNEVNQLKDEISILSK